MQVAIDARYLCEPFGSMTVFCGTLLTTLSEMELPSPPAALIPNELDPSAHELHDRLGDSVRWVRPRRERLAVDTLPEELRWVHRDVPTMLATSVPDADVLIMPYHHPPARAPGVRRVVVLHDLCGLGLGFPRHKQAYWMHYLRLRAAAHLADTILPISHATREEMATRFPASRRRLGPVVYNGVDRRPVPQDAMRSVLDRHSLEPRSYVVAFATWQERKNFAASLAAVSLLRRRGTPVRLVGISPGREQQSIQARCVAEGHDDALILSGIPDADLDALYAGSLSLLWPSTCEGFGYPVVEAMTQGCPPLVAPFGPGVELVDGTIEPLGSLAPETIAARVEALLAATPEDRARLQGALRARAGEFSSAAYREQLRAALVGVGARR